MLPPPVQDSDNSSDTESDNDLPTEPTILNPYSLYLQFPTKFDKDRNTAIEYIKSLNPKIIKVRLARQKALNFCHVDFDCQSDCDEAYELLKTKKVRTNDPKKMDNIIVKIPLPPDSQIRQNKLQSIKAKREQKKILNQLVIHIRNTLNKDPRRTVSNILFVKNCPRKMTTKDMKQVFPDLVNAEFIIPKNDEAKAMYAYVTLPSPRDAKVAAKKRKHFFKDNKLTVTFARMVKNSKRTIRRERAVAVATAAVTDDIEIKQEDLSSDDDDFYNENNEQTLQDVEIKMESD